MDCLNFLDRRIDPPSDVEPVNVKVRVLQCTFINDL